MRIAVLGGLGLQGKAALYDLSRSPDVSEIICADVAPRNLGSLERLVDKRKVRIARLDASSSDAIASLFGTEIDAVIDLLPQPFMANAIRAALEARIDLVTTNYVHGDAGFHERARAIGVAVMPECGLDPGIDLAIYGHAVKQFDELHVLNSYCGGLPEQTACDNPLDYKISWNWDMVLRSQTRDSVFIRDGRRVEVPAERQHDSDFVHRIDVPDIGEMEAVPNGDGVFYTDLLGVTGSIRETGRYALRWPGWCAFWAPLTALGFLSDEPVPGLACRVTPREFMGRHLEPRLQFREQEGDLVVMVNVFEGLSGGRRKRLTSRLVLRRDAETGLLGMALGVGYPVSIVAQMFARGEIQRTGLLSPALDIPYESFVEELGRRGVAVVEESSWMD